MKILIINGSPHKDGTCSAALQELERTLISEGVECNTVHVGGLALHGCLGCGGCASGGGCVIDDKVNEAARLFEESDGLIVGSPVHYASPTGAVISFMDRLFYSTRFDKSFKVGAAVVVARRGGCTAAFDVLNKYFTISGMPIVSSSYWNQVHGRSKEDAVLDKEGMQCMRNLGRNAAYLMKSIALSKGSLAKPLQERGERTDFIRKNC